MKMIVRYAMLAVALLVLAVMLYLSATPTYWRITGSPSEEYPEFWFLFIGSPLSFAASGFGALWARVHARWIAQPRRALGLVVAFLGWAGFLVATALGFILLAEGSVLS
jgi:hypothetical protein